MQFLQQHEIFLTLFVQLKKVYVVQFVPKLSPVSFASRHPTSIAYDCNWCMNGCLLSVQ